MRLDGPKSERPIPLHFHEAEHTSDGHYGKVLTMSAPGGPEQPLAAAGKPTDERVFSDEPEELDLEALRGPAAEVDVYLA